MNATNTIFPPAFAFVGQTFLSVSPPGVSLYGKDGGRTGGETGRNACPTKCRRGFTLVELLVVIGIIAMLVGLLMPALSAARRQVRLVRELAASRQLMVAYLNYTTDHRGALLPGHINYTLALDDDRGVPLSPPEVTKRWPWRLVAYIRYGMRGTILVNDQEEILADRSSSFWPYMVSLTPSFGYNYFNVGGDMNTANNAPGCVRKITESRQSSRLIVFASSRSSLPQGYFQIAPPRHHIRSWTNVPYYNDPDPTLWGYVHPRFNGRAVVACLDGHSETLSIAELRDMTRWSQRAAALGDANWNGLP